MVAHSQSQNWVFKTEDTTASITQTQDGIGTLEFRCLQAGSPGANPDLVQWWIKAPSLLNELAIAEGDLVSIALQLDGSDGGHGAICPAG